MRWLHVQDFQHRLCRRQGMCGLKLLMLLHAPRWRHILCWLRLRMFRHSLWGAALQVLTAAPRRWA